MTNSVLQRIDPACLPEANKLYLDFLSYMREGLPPYLGGFCGDAVYWQRAVEASQLALERIRRSSDVVDPGKVMDELRRFNEKLGVKREVLDKIDLAERGEAFFVVTGQQPGILGGSLMVAYKAATALALAKWLEECISIVCIPLYWVGADDSDFQEIRELKFLASDLSPVKISLPHEAHTAGRPVGQIAIEWSRKMWDGIAPLVGAYQHAEYVGSVVEGTLEKAADHGEAAAAAVTAIFKGEIAVVDGRASFLKTFARRVFADYLAREEEIKAAVRSQGEKLRADGYHSQIDPGEDSGIFLLQDGKRCKVGPRELPLLKQAIEEQVEKCSPGVILRNLVQDFVFRPLAVILGPAEMAYRAQLSLVYESFGMEQPAAVPRMTATYVPPDMLQVLHDAKLPFEVLLSEPARFADSIAERAAVPHAGTVKQKFLASLDDSLSKLGGEIGKYLSPDSLTRFEKHAIDARRRFERALDVLDEAGMKEALKKWPWLKELSGIFTPGDASQERYFSLLIPLLFSGEKGGDDILKVSRAYVDDLLQGKAAHFIYSA